MTDLPQTVLVVSSPTSATGSIWRACLALGRGIYEPIAAGDKFWREKRMDELRHWVPPERGAIVLMNSPSHFNTALDLSRYRYVLNARDPRDLACNQFHWKFVHPSPSDGPGDLERRAEAARALGVDGYALKANNGPIYKALQHITVHAPRENWMFLGYAMWCLQFDEAVSRLAAFLGIDPATLPPEQRDSLMRERTPEIASNPQWVGQRWQGADTAPGRHRGELRAETIATLTKRHAEELAWLKEVDDPRMRELYS